VKKLISTARNITHSIHNQKIYTEIEAVLGVEEPFIQYINGRVMNLQTPGTLRFGLSIETADALLGELAQWIEDARKQAAMLELKKAGE
jgi:hypothetical protein